MCNRQTLQRSIPSLVLQFACTKVRAGTYRLGEHFRPCSPSSNTISMGRMEFFVGGLALHIEGELHFV